MTGQRFRAPRQVPSLSGQLLVASPHLGESDFARSVVLILHHDPSGAYGVVVNRPAPETVQSLWAKLGQSECHDKRQIHFGGPLPGPVVALHDNTSLAEMKLPGGICVAAEIGRLHQLVRQTGTPLRLVVGHAGWAPGQLEAELRSGDWMILPGSLDHIFTDDVENLWVESIRRIGRSVIERLKIPHIPGDPSWN